MSPSKRNRRKRPRGEGAVFQRCETRRGCPPREPVTQDDGTIRMERPDHKCRGLWIARLDLGRGPDNKPHRPQRAALTKNGALAALQEIKDQVTKYGDAPSRNMKVEQWLRQWLDEIVQPSKGPKTYRNARSVVTKHLIPGVGRHRIDKLQPKHLRDLYDLMGSDGRTGSRPETHRVIRKALGDAMREGLVMRNVAKLVDPPAGKGTKRTALTAEQGRLLLRHAHREVDGQLVDPLASRWGMALLTAARQGECLGLEWSRVDMDARVMDVAWQMQRLIFSHGCGDQKNGQWPCGMHRGGSCPERHLQVPGGYEYRQLDGGMCLTRPKSEASVRLLPIPAPLYADLLAHRERDTGPNPHGLVWHEEDGSPIDASTDRARWDANLQAAGLPDVVLHEARHTTITLLMEAGTDPAVIQAIAGHASLAVQQAYKHADVRHMAEALGHVAGELYLAEVED